MQITTGGHFAVNFARIQVRQELCRAKCKFRSARALSARKRILSRRDKHERRTALVRRSLDYTTFPKIFILVRERGSAICAQKKKHEMSSVHAFAHAECAI